MSESTSIDDFRALTKRAGLDLTDDELEHLKPMYDHYLEPITSMNALDLDAEDLAVVYSPGWDPEV
ncbi:MAG: hypothetical protein F4X34_05640 [Chloroflexi bacterium]|nr:hypothetical protein [Chloroflexota bacterium]